MHSATAGFAGLIICLADFENVLPARAMAEHLSSVPEWKELETHYKEAKEWHMRDMFTDDPGRFDKFRCLAHLFFCNSR